MKVLTRGKPYFTLQSKWRLVLIHTCGFVIKTYPKLIKPMNRFGGTGGRLTNRPYIWYYIGGRAGAIGFNENFIQIWNDHFWFWTLTEASSWVLLVKKSMINIMMPSCIIFLARFISTKTLQFIGYHNLVTATRMCHECYLLFTSSTTISTYEPNITADLEASPDQALKYARNCEIRVKWWSNRIWWSVW